MSFYFPVYDTKYSRCHLFNFLFYRFAMPQGEKKSRTASLNTM